MKRVIFFAQAVILSSVFLVHPANSFQTSGPAFPYYVVIGAFASQANAETFTLQARSQNFSASFEMNRGRNLYYVFVRKSQDRAAAVNEALRLQRESPYTDAWVYNGTLGNEEQITLSPVVQETDAVDNNIKEAVQENTIETPVLSADLTESSANDTTQETHIMNSSNLVPVGSDLKAEDLVDRTFVFQAYRATDNQLLDAEIDVIDVDKSRKMNTFKSNMPVEVIVPKSKSKDVSFICQSFGYRKAQKEFSFNTPSAEGLFQDDAGNLVVTFALIRLQKGDIAVMYNVFYFKDAAIMRPESRYEVNNLLQMLKENPDYKIKLHGHTNGNAAGKIITRGESEDLFSLTGSKDGFGSAKQLSEERAKAIRDYLFSNGVAEDRIEVKAWGGKRPIHDKHSTRAQENIRVEVEILDH